MTAHSLQTLVAEALADIGLAAPAPEHGRASCTKWLPGAHGIGLRSYPSGRSVYVVQTRMAGRLRMVTIGRTSVISEAQAIIVARRVLAHALVGNDPAETRKRIRAAPPWAPFLEQYWRACSPSWKPSTRSVQDIYRRVYLNTAFADMTIDAIGEPEVTRWFAEVTRQSGPGGANRCLSILNAMMVKAENWGYREEGSNPCRAVKQNRRKKLERYLSEPELARLGAALLAGRDNPVPEQRIAVAVITLLLLTGCRKGEIVSLRWTDVRGLRIKLADAKAGPRTVWLSLEARRVIDALPRPAKGVWLFQGRNGQISDNVLDKVWREVKREADLTGLRLHDLRHTFASHAAQRSETLPMIGKLLGHASLTSTARYAHLDDASVRAANEQIGRRLIECLAGGLKPSQSEVA